jgi:hypothetical protein
MREKNAKCVEKFLAANTAACICCFMHALFQLKYEGRKYQRQKIFLDARVARRN